MDQNRNRPIRTTILMGALSSLFYFIIYIFVGFHIFSPGIFNLVVFFGLGCYAVLLCRWGEKRIINISFPLLLMAVLSFIFSQRTMYSNAGTMLIILGLFGWIRSGICFSTGLMRGFITELILGAGGAWLTVTLGAGSVVSFGIGIWLFFLVQTLFFVIIPGSGIDVDESSQIDRFEHARINAERIIEGL